MWAPVAGTILALWPRLDLVGLHEDEGVVSAWASLVAAGQVPYRDFFTFATPGAAFLYGAEYRLLGVSVFGDRLLTSLGILAAVALLAAIALRFLPPPGAAAVALLWGVWLPVFLGYSQYHFWCITLALAATLALLIAFETGRLHWWALAGGAAALAFLFLQSLLTLAPALLLVAFLRGRPVLPRLLALAAGAMVPVALLIGYLLATGSFADFFRDTAGFTVGTYRSFNRQPFPWNPLLLGDTLNWRAGEAAYWEFPMFWLLVLLLPVVVAGVAAFLTLGAVLGRARLGPGGVLAIVSSALFASVVLGLIGGPLGWLAAPLALVLLAGRIDASTRGRRQLLALAPALTLLLIGLAPAPVGWALSCDYNPGGRLLAVKTQAGSVCVRSADAPALREAVTLVAANPGRRVAFQPSALELYELTGTQPIGQPLWLLNGLVSPALLGEQERALLDPRVEYLLYVNDVYLDLGHPWAVDDFLAANFKIESAVKTYTLYRRAADT